MLSCVNKGKTVQYRRSPTKNLELYLNRIGFYAWGEGLKGKAASPIQAELRHLGAINPIYTENIIKVMQLYLNLSQGVQDSLKLTFNELMENAFDHSQTTMGCFVCAQAFPKRGEVNICLADFGRGILKSLSSSEKYNYLKDSIEAIELSIQKGVSSRKNGAAGLGLTFIHDFLKLNEGRIHIISGNGWIHWNYKQGALNQIKRKKLDIEFDGTIVNIIARADGKGLYMLSTEKPRDDIF